MAIPGVCLVKLFLHGMIEYQPFSIQEPAFVMYVMYRLTFVCTRYTETFLVFTAEAMHVAGSVFHFLDYIKLMSPCKQGELGYF